MQPAYAGVDRSGYDVGSAIPATHYRKRSMHDQPIESWIREQRKARKWTQADLARKLPENPGTVQHWESGRRAPTRKDCDRIARVFGVSGSEVWSRAVWGRMAPEERDTIEAEIRTIRAEAEQRIAAREGLTPAETALIHRMREIEQAIPGAGVAQGLAALISGDPPQVSRTCHALAEVDPRDRASIASTLNSLSMALARPIMAARRADYARAADEAAAQVAKLQGFLEIASADREAIAAMAADPHRAPPPVDVADPVLVALVQTEDEIETIRTLIAHEGASVAFLKERLRQAEAGG
jgi:transcriptional regulator with XRE-family HTH domain